MPQSLHSPRVAQHAVPAEGGGLLSARAARSVLAAVATLAVLLVAAVPAVAAGAGKFRIGVVEGQLTTGDMNAIGRSGADVLRFNFSWKQAERGHEPCTGYEWGDLDRMVSESSAAGFRLLPIITDSPEYVSGTSDGRQAPHTRDTVDIRAYRCFVTAAVQRYGRGGDFAARRGIRPITDWQAWNEPNLTVYASRGDPNPREYARFVKQTHRTVAREDPRANVILAGMPEYTSRGIDLDPYLRRFYRTPRVERAFDAVAIHAFARGTPGVKGALIRLNRTLRRVGDGSRPVWVTETSWATGGSTPPWLVKSAKGQAKTLRRTFNMFSANRDRFNLGTVHWFRWRDTVSPGESEYAFFYSGLYRRDGQPKPSCRAFSRLAGGSTCVPQIDDGPTVTSTERSLLTPQQTSTDLEPSPSE